MRGSRLHHHPFHGSRGFGDVSKLPTLCPLLLPLAATGSLRTLAPEPIQTLLIDPPSPAASRRLGLPTLPAAVPEAAAGPSGREPLASRRDALLGAPGPLRSGGIAVGDHGGFFCPGALSVPFLLLLFPAASPQSHFLFS